MGDLWMVLFDITVVPVLLIALATLAISGTFERGLCTFYGRSKEWATFIGAVYAMGMLQLPSGR